MSIPHVPAIPIDTATSTNTAVSTNAFSTWLSRSLERRMRLLHTSDWHLGRTLYGEDLLTHQAAFLDWLLAEAIERQVHAVVVAGDVYDRAVPTTDAVAVLDQALRGFAAAHVPVLLTSGNHDSAVRLGFGSRLS